MLCEACYQIRYVHVIFEAKRMAWIFYWEQGTGGTNHGVNYGGMGGCDPTNN